MGIVSFGMSIVGSSSMAVGEPAIMHHFSRPLYLTARSLAVSLPGPSNDPAATVAAAVILAATALEAFVNEQISLAAPNAAALRGQDLFPRWSGLARQLTKRSLSGRVEPWGSFVHLVELRNVLVHDQSRPRFGGNFPSTLATLNRRFQFSNARPNEQWDRQVLNAACARWACNTAVEAVRGYWGLRNLPIPAPDQWELVP